MRIIKIGKRQFAFDLNWNESFGDDAQEAVINANGVASPSLYTVVEGDDEDVLGYALAGDTKGPVYSYAQALLKAKPNVDGIYAAPVGAGQVWFVAIIKGVVVAASDRTMDEYDAEDEVRDLLRSKDIPVFAADGCLSSLQDVLAAKRREIIPFDLEKIVAKVKLKPLKRTVRTGNSFVGVALLTVVVVGLCFGAWAMFFREPEAVDPAVLEAEARASYVAAASMELAKLPVDASWAGEAYRWTVLSFPPFISGWAFDGVTCEPSSCTAVYVLDQTAAGYSIAAIYALFDRQQVSVLPDRKSLNVQIPLPVRNVEPFTEDEIYNPAPADIDAIDVLGAMSILFAEVELDGDLKVEALNQGLSAPTDAPVLHRESFATSYKAAIDSVMLRNLCAFMADAGFVARKMSYSTGSGAVPRSWRIEWVRVHGGNR